MTVRREAHTFLHETVTLDDGAVWCPTCLEFIETIEKKNQEETE